MNLDWGLRNAFCINLCFFKAFRNHVFISFNPLNQAFEKDHLFFEVDPLVLKSLLLFKIVWMQEHLICNFLNLIILLLIFLSDLSLLIKVTVCSFLNLPFNLNNLFLCWGNLPLCACLLKFLLGFFNDSIDSELSRLKITDSMLFAAMLLRYSLNLSSNWRSSLC